MAASIWRFLSFYFLLQLSVYLVPSFVSARELNVVGEAVVSEGYMFACELNSICVPIEPLTSINLINTIEKNCK